MTTSRGSGRCRIRPLFQAGLVLLTGACATSGLRAPQAADVPRLEAALATDSSAASTKQQLAVAYREAGEPERALALLEPLVHADSSDPVTTLYLGLSYEDVGRTADARRLYEALLRLAPQAAVRSGVERRLELLGRRELQESARAAAAGERAAESLTPSERTVGVFPFLSAASDSALRPLTRAFAELLTTDLAQTDRLRVLERVQVQYLVDEIEMGESGLVDPATAARAGRMLRAAHIVQGRIGGTAAAMDVEALLVPTATPDELAGPAMRHEGALSRVLDMEKEIALGTYQRLGIQLTAAERQRVNERPTQNVQALLAFGFGLEALDAGRYPEAANHFAQAVRLDPGFRRARELLAQAETLAAAGTTRALGRLALSHYDLRLSPWQRRRMTLDVLQILLPPALLRDVTVELLGTEGLARSGFEIIIRRPGGSSP